MERIDQLNQKLANLQAIPNPPMKILHEIYTTQKMIESEKKKIKNNGKKY